MISTPLWPLWVGGWGGALGSLSMAGRDREESGAPSQSTPSLTGAIDMSNVKLAPAPPAAE